MQRKLIYKNIFANGCTSNWSEEVFVTKKVNTFPCTYVIEDLISDEIVERFYEKSCKSNLTETKTNQTEFWIEKVTKRKGDKLLI